jgi:predicted phage tail component-like protein
MSINGFTFNGVHSDSFFMVNRINRSIAPNVTENLVKVPRRAGSYDFGTEISERRFSIDVTLIEFTTEHLADKMRAITEWLIDGTDELKELKFDTDPDIVYRARFVGDSDLTTLGPTGTASLTFLAPDPHAYSPLIGIEARSGSTMINYGANAKGYPRLQFNVKEPITSLNIARLGPSGVEHLLLGSNASVEQSVVYKDKRVLWDEMADPTKWTRGGIVDNNGKVEGRFLANSSGWYMYPESYSDDSSYQPDTKNPRSGPYSGWHGPSAIRALETPVQDFRAEFQFDIYSGGVAEVGRVQMYMLDVNGKVLAALTMGDNGYGTKNGRGVARVGPEGSGTNILNHLSRYWTDFRGGMWIRRVGNRWDAHVYERLPNGTHTSRYSSRNNYGFFYDKGGKWSDKVAQIQIHVGAYRDYAPLKTTGLLDVKVYSLGEDAKENEVPIIAEQGDVIEVDMAKSAVYFNGEARMELLNPTSKFISLEKGGNEIIYEDDKADLNIEYRERWL